MPRVSIGMPVYNGERFLTQGVASILNQTFGDFELVVSDNASTDGTQEICATYAVKDRRLRYYRNEHNLGAMWNHNRVFELSKGEYFRWAAHDDVCAPQYLERCVEVLDRDSSVILCHCKTAIVDENGRLLEKYDIILNTDSPRPQDRFHDLILRVKLPVQMYGLIRRAKLKMARPMGSHIGSDMNLLAELALLGRFYEIPEYLFFRREHPRRSVRLHRDERELLTWHSPARTGQISLPRWRMLAEYARSVRRTPLSWPDRLACYAYIGEWAARYAYRGRRRSLARDLMVAAKQILVPARGTPRRGV